LDFRADVRRGIVHFDGLIAHVLSSLSGSMPVDQAPGLVGNP
jgi:hypothetical protein